MSDHRLFVVPPLDPLTVGFFLLVIISFLCTLSLCQEGTTPLMMAAAAGHVDCCRELISQGADPTLRRKVGL